MRLPGASGRPRNRRTMAPSWTWRQRDLRGRVSSSENAIRVGLHSVRSLECGGVGRGGALFPGGIPRDPGGRPTPQSVRGVRVRPGARAFCLGHGAVRGAIGSVARLLAWIGGPLSDRAVSHAADRPRGDGADSAAGLRGTGVAAARRPPHAGRRIRDRRGHCCPLERPGRLGARRGGRFRGRAVGVSQRAGAAVASSGPGLFSPRGEPPRPRLSLRIPGHVCPERLRERARAISTPEPGPAPVRRRERQADARKAALARPSRLAA